MLIYYIHMVFNLYNQFVKDNFHLLRGTPQERFSQLATIWKNTKGGIKTYSPTYYTPNWSGK